MKSQVGRILSECYGCAENNAEWCKICQESLCKACHKLFREDKHSEYLSPHQYYEMTIRGVEF